MTDNVFWYKDGARFIPPKEPEPDYVPDTGIKEILLWALKLADDLECIFIVARNKDGEPLFLNSDMHPDTMVALGFLGLNFTQNETFNTTMEYTADIRGTDDEADN